MPSKQIFCQRCHKPVAEVRTGKDKTQIIQGGRVLISLSKQSNTSITVHCPDGHNVKVEI